MPSIEVDRERARKYIQQTRLEFAHQDHTNDQRTEKITEQLETSDNDPQSWRTLTDKAADFVAEKGCPAWDVTDPEKAMWSEGLAESLDRYFPGALDGFDNWHPVAKLLGASCVIAAMRIDFANGGFAPLHHTKEGDNDRREQEGRTLNIDQRQDAERENDGGFTTDGE